MVRDPYDWVLARARFFMSENFEGRTDNLKGGKIETNDLLNMMISASTRRPTLEEIFRHNAVAWLGTKAYLIRYEEMVGHLKRLDSKQAELYFAGLFDACGIAMTDDWRKRVESAPTASRARRRARTWTAPWSFRTNCRKRRSGWWIMPRRVCAPAAGLRAAIGLAGEAVSVSIKFGTIPGLASPDRDCAIERGLAAVGVINMRRAEPDSRSGIFSTNVAPRAQTLLPSQGGRDHGARGRTL